MKSHFIRLSEQLHNVDVYCGAAHAPFGRSQTSNHR